MAHKLWNAIVLLAALAITKIPMNSKLVSSEADSAHLADISSRNQQQSVWSKRDISPNDNLEKLTREAQLSSEKENEIGNSRIVDLIYNHNDISVNNRLHIITMVR